ncbi:MAG TPA: hypothetical protein VFZ70_14540 [Euzebyales bacterium]
MLVAPLVTPILGRGAVAPDARVDVTYPLITEVLEAGLAARQACRRSPMVAMLCSTDHEVAMAREHIPR